MYTEILIFWNLSLGCDSVNTSKIVETNFSNSLMHGKKSYNANFQLHFLPKSKYIFLKSKSLYS